MEISSGEKQNLCEGAVVIPSLPYRSAAKTNNTGAANIVLDPPVH